MPTIDRQSAARRRRGRRGARVALLLLALTGLFAPAAGAGTVELTPFVGYRFGGEIDATSLSDDVRVPIGAGLEVDESSIAGVILGYRFGRHWQLELHVDRQETELQLDTGIFARRLPLVEIDLDTAQIGLTYQWGPGQLQPFFGAAVGATRLDPQVAQLDSVTKFSLSFGGGLKVLFNDHVGLRLEGRLFATLIDERDLEFCEGFDCRDFSRDDFLEQGDVRAGLILAF